MPKCENCGYYFSSGDCTLCKTPEQRKNKTDAESRQILEKKLDTIFSIYIRLSNADKFGFCLCFTCGDRMFWKHIQCGHWISREIHALRWEVKNSKPQCGTCNGEMRGMFGTFKQKLEQKYGLETVDMIQRKMNETYKPTIAEMNEMISYFEKEVKKLKSIK